MSGLMSAVSPITRAIPDTHSPCPDRHRARTLHHFRGDRPSTGTITPALRWNVAMTAKRPLPPALQNRPFSVREARDAGVSRSRLRAGDLEIPTRGARRLILPTGTRASDAGLEDPSSHAVRLSRMRADLIDRATSFAPMLTDDQFVSHSSGLALMGAPLPFTHDREYILHISARRPSAQPQRRGAVGHRLQQRDADRLILDGVPIETPARLWRQAATTWKLDDLIVAGDFLVCPKNGLLSIDDLWREIEEAGDVRRGILTRAMEEIRVGSESSGETELRLALVRAGLPEPDLNWTLLDERGGFVARLDIAYRRYRVAPEYDGRGHATGAQFRKDADRWDAIRAQNWDHVRILSHHLRPNPQVAVDKVARALIAAGWIPGQG
ncbi:hypothetical protein OED01_05660 [Microbacterium sp. M28]|uniref:hypothetical protein n=1 Tax=Microbacterium sp. M28 TaxID=2962064 RepID=UPI0021F47103|nr:hypothetical protein [Microbacterium sp. M28]UYO98195.1 hypothetical protein OED01_05660 [Microbacterium sp. M28]